MRALFFLAVALFGVTACQSTGPQRAFDLASDLACTQEQYERADGSCLVLSDPRVSDPADRAALMAGALNEAGIQSREVWVFPKEDGARTLGFAEVDNRGPCFRARNCGEGWPYYVALAMDASEGGSPIIIDPATLRGPAPLEAWMSRLLLNGFSLVDVTWQFAETNTDVEAAQRGLRHSYCEAMMTPPKGRNPLRGYTRPLAVPTSCSAPAS